MNLIKNSNKFNHTLYFTDYFHIYDLFFKSFLTKISTSKRETMKTSIFHCLMSFSYLGINLIHTIYWCHFIAIKKISSGFRLLWREEYISGLKWGSGWCKKMFAASLSELMQQLRPVQRNFTDFLLAG